MKPKPAATGKSKFSAQERAMMITLPWLAGAAVSECDKVGGIRATAREMEVLSKAVAAAFTAYQLKTDENLSAEPSTFDFEQAEAQFFQSCPQVLAMLEPKDTAANVDHYKTVVLEVAYAVAAAYGAGFLGRGEKVSQAESALLDKIAQALKGTHLLDAVKKNAEVGKLK
jgi:hypothetical protein